MPALVAHMAGLVDGLDVASAGELARGARRRDGSARDQLRRAREDARPSSRRRWPRASWSTSSRSARSVCSRRSRSALGAAARVAVRVNPDFELKSSGMKMGGGPEAVRHRCRARSAGAREIGESGLAFEGFQSSAARRTCAPKRSATRRRRRSSWRCGSPSTRPSPVRFLNLGGGFGIPYFPGDEPLDLAPIGEQSREHRRAAQSRAARSASWSSSSDATSSARRASTCAGSSTARCRAAKCSSSPTAACITTWPHPATSAR